MHTKTAKLKNGKSAPPSHKISILISKILEVEPEILLVAAHQYYLTKQMEDLVKELASAYPEKDRGLLMDKASEIVSA